MSVDKLVGVSQILTIDCIEVDPNQPRKEITNIEELAISIRSNGLIQPIIVRPHDEEIGKYIIVSGERRFAAVKSLLMKEVECKVVEVENSTDIDLIQIIENIQRVDMTPFDTATAIKKIHSQLKKNKDVARAIGKTETYISRHLSLLKGGELTNQLAGKTSDVIALSAFAKIEEKQPQKAKIMFEQMERENFENTRKIVDNKPKKEKKAIKNNRFILVVDSIKLEHVEQAQNITLFSDGKEFKFSLENNKGELIYKEK